MASAFVLRENVDFCFELLVWLDGTGLGQNLAALDVRLLDATEEDADVFASACFVEKFAEHFDVGDGRLDGVTETDDFDFFHLLEDAAFHTTGDDCAATFDVEHVFERHEERLVDRALRKRDEGIKRVHEVADALRIRVVCVAASQRFGSRALHDWRIVAGEIVLREKVTNFHFDEFQKVRIGEVNLVQEDDDLWHTDLARKKDVLLGLRHWAIGSGDDEDCSVHLRCAGDHVLHVIGVSGAVNVRVVAVRRAVFDVRDGDGDGLCVVTDGAAFGDVCVADWVRESFEGLNVNDCCGGSGFPVVNVADGADVHMGLLAFECFLGHGVCVLCCLS